MRLTGSQALMEIFRQEGVEYIFGIPGATEVLFMDALEDCPDIRYILGLHEVVAAGMAEGYARASGKVGVLNLHTNTGLSAALPLLANSFTGGVPLIITAGQQDTRLHAYEPHLTGDLVKIAAPVTKWGTEATYLEDLPTIFRRAFKLATHPPTGPVFVSLPQNILEDHLDFEYIKGGPSYTHVRPDPESIKSAIDLLSRAQNPAIILQDGVAKSDALAEVVELAELIGARVYQPWMGDVNFPVNHPLYAGDLDTTSLHTRELLAKIDVLVAIGTALISPVFYLPQPLLTLSTKIIHIDDNPREIGKNFPTHSGIEGDIKVAVAELTAALEKKMETQSRKAAKLRTQEIESEKKKADKAFVEKALNEQNDVPISASRLMQEIKENLPAGSRIVDDCWSVSGILRRTLGFSEPKSYMRSRSGGSIGWGLPGALGVKLASPDRPVVGICGDGSAMWSIQSLWTAARYQIPVTYIICANACYQQVRIMKNHIFGEKAKGRYLGTDLCSPQNDFCRIAEGMGVQAQRVEKPDQLKATLQKAFNLNQPNLVEVRMKV